tara:strand:+ start:106 stop:270 length:165 start_codon:yes stop_codon:yes gene_type:complete
MKFQVYIKGSKNKDVIMKLESASLTSAIDDASRIKKLDRKSFTDLFTVKPIIKK